MDEELQIQSQNDSIGSVVEEDQLLLSKTETPLNDTTETDELDVEITENVLEVTIEGGGITVQSQNHNDLHNLDYAHSGHTGFASSEQVVSLNNRVGSVEQSVMSLNNRVSDLEEAVEQLSEDIEKKVQTVNQVPSDAKSTQYFFKLLN